MNKENHAQVGAVVLASPYSTPESGNPYIGLLYQELARQGIEVRQFSRRALWAAPDVLHVHWPEQLIRWSSGRVTAFLDIVKVLVLIARARRRGTSVVWTAHNIRPHDVPMPRLYAAYMSAFGRMTDAVISLSDAAIPMLQLEHHWLTRDRVTTIAHGHYRDVYPAPPEREEARRVLCLLPGDRVVLLMGQIRRYKNVPGLIRTFEGLSGSDLRLVVAGSASGDHELMGELDAAVGARTTLRLGHVPHEEVPVLHAAADVVVLPYSGASVLNSGAAILALSFGRPVVVRVSPPMEELQAVIGKEWVYLFDGDVDAALQLSFVAMGDTREAIPDLSTLNWVTLGDKTADLFRKLIEDRSNGDFQRYWRLSNP